MVHIGYTNIIYFDVPMGFFTISHVISDKYLIKYAINEWFLLLTRGNYFIIIYIYIFHT